MTISAIILARNEENTIIDCIESLSFCDEILVIDDASSDLTPSLAKKAGVTVIPHLLENDFSAARNFGLEKAKGEWVLFVDADERVSADLRNEIIYKTARKNDIQGFFIQRVDFMGKKLLKHGETAHTTLLRLAKKGAGEWKGTVHETWEVKGKKETLESPLLHYPHPSIDTFLQEINFYTDLRARQLYKQGVHVTWFTIIFYPKMKFIQNYFFRLGFLDGVEGMIMAIMMSLHSFLVRGKLWQLWDQKNT